jgi:Homing endonuclease associated repeat
MKRYTDEELLDILREKARELGRTPKQREVSCYSTLQERFGSFNRALELAGLEVSRKNYTDEELLDMIRDKAKELGRTPQIRDVPNYATIRSRFGSWNHALELAGFEKQRIYYTDEDLIKIIRDKTKELGRPPRRRELIQYQAIKDHFGSWEKGLIAAGVKKPKELEQPKLSSTEKRKRKLERSIEELKRLSEEQGFPTIIEWARYAREHGLFSYIKLQQHYKMTWNEIRKHLGYPRGEYTKEVCAEAMRMASEELGIAFSKKQYEQWRKKKGYPSMNVICKRFNKSFNGVKEELGLIINEKPAHALEYTEEDMKKAILDCHQFYGRKFTEMEYQAWRRQEKVPRPNIETIRIYFGSIPELKEGMDIETYYPSNPYGKDDYRQHVYNFIRSQLSLKEYERWAEENKAMSIIPVLRRADSFEKALLDVLPEFIKYLSDHNK